MKAHCPAKCGKLFISPEHAKSHADIEHPEWDKPQNIKQKGWGTPYGFVDFSYPVTYEDACEQAKSVFATIKWPDKPQPLTKG